MLLPEYYLTERELEIIEHHRQGIAAAAANTPFNLVELGAGFSQKSMLFLEHFAKTGLAFQYVPIDISESAMAELVNSLEELIPRLEVNGLVTDYFNGLKWLNHRYRRRNLVLFLGSSIGNFTHRGACFFLGSCGTVSITTIVVMIGFDMKKDIDLLLRAYNDSEGVTREFNLNLLHRINRELGGRFDAGKFRYFGTYNVFSGAMESYLVSQERQTVFIEAIGRSFCLSPGNPSIRSIPTSIWPQTLINWPKRLDLKSISTSTIRRATLSTRSGEFRSRECRTVGSRLRMTAKAG